MHRLKFLSFLLALLFMLSLCLSACNNPEEKAPVPPKMEDLDFSDVSLDEMEASDQITEYVKFEIKDYGTVIIRLFSKVAPITVANFQQLVSDGFYDGLIFHRVIEGFMIQGGDPLGNGTGGADEDIKGEFALNNFENNLEHIRGVISMARGGHPYEAYLPYYTYEEMGLSFEDFEPFYNSASSQFYIVHQTSPHLNGNYAGFGYFVYGMDVVDAIAEVETNSSDKPLTDVVIENATFMKKK